MENNKLGEELIKEGSPKIQEKDLEKVVNKSDEIQKKFRSRGPLQRFVDDGRLLIAAARDYWAGRYRRMPWGTVAAVVFTLLYVLNPLDLIPDVLPIIGELDDAAVIAACLFLVEMDLTKYREWKEDGQPPALKPPEEGKR
jgi:uncharacterized membrane protein YkvA (DUF1232 family)